jgi:hypothetical protein
MGSLHRVLNGWLDALEARRPPGFPAIALVPNGRRFPSSVPFDTEREVLGREAMENILNDPRLEHRWWGPRRRGLSVRSPATAFVNFHEGGCVVDFSFGRLDEPWVSSITVGGSSHDV